MLDATLLERLKADGWSLNEEVCSFNFRCSANTCAQHYYFGILSIHIPHSHPLVTQAVGQQLEEALPSSAANNAKQRPEDILNAILDLDLKQVCF